MLNVIVVSDRDNANFGRLAAKTVVRFTFVAGLFFIDENRKRQKSPPE